MNAWMKNAKILSHWAGQRLVNRFDVWGGYFQTSREVRRTTCPSLPHRQAAFLNYDVLQAHFETDHTNDVIGLHTIGTDNTCRWGAVDIDHHGEDEAPQDNWQMALQLYRSAQDVGFEPLLFDSNGNGGFHLYLLFNQPVASVLVYRLMKWLIHQQAWKNERCAETFPKQETVGPDRPYGNWLRCPGKHHSRKHWSRLWQERWLDDTESVSALLHHAGDDPRLIPDLTNWSSRHLDTESLLLEPPGPAWTYATLPDKRVIAYLNAYPPAISGQGGHNVTFRIAKILVWEFNLPTEHALQLLLTHWNQRCSPPWSERELRHKVEDANRVPSNSERGFRIHDTSWKTPVQKKL